jgi:hypothetical protein
MSNPSAKTDFSRNAEGVRTLLRGKWLMVQCRGSVLFRRGVTVAVFAALNSRLSGGPQPICLATPGCTVRSRRAPQPRPLRCYLPQVQPIRPIVLMAMSS